MSKRMVLMSVLLTMVVSLAGMSAANASELTSFLYEGLNYVPLKSTASFLGAPVRWDAAKRQAVVTYMGQDFALTPNSSKALYAGQPVVLSSPPVIINGVTYVPLETFKKYYNVPVQWDRSRSEVKIKGTSGWRTMKANSRPPWHGGPPPWAPAWGQRGYGTPGHPSNVKANGKAKGNKPALASHKHGTPSHPSNVKANGNGKLKGNKKDD